MNICFQKEKKQLTAVKTQGTALSIHNGYTHHLQVLYGSGRGFDFRKV